MKDFWKRKRNKRIAASALAVVMAGFLVWGLFPWQAAAAKTTVADNVTINKWHDSEALDDSTKNVGRIWTDKSVSTGNVELTKPGSNEKKIIQKNGESDFLVGLSALSSTAKIMGQTTVPLDIVLILDVSGSMDDPSGSYEEVYDLNTQNAYYVLVNGRYQKVEYWSGSLIQGWYYSWSNTKVVPKTSANDSDPSHVQFYAYRASSTTKMEMLQDAVNGFIEKAAEKNNNLSDTNKQSRISLVKFAGNKPDKDAVGNSTYKDDNGHKHNYTQIVKGYDTYTKKNMSELQNLVNKLDPAGATSADYAMDLAKQLVSPEKPSSNDDLNPRENAKKIVIFFTDGQPNHYDGFDNTVANNAIKTAKSIKEDASIYTIGVFNDANASITGGAEDNLDGWTSEQKFNAYMHGMSSNYPNAVAYNNLGERAKDSKGHDTQFYKAATDAADLNSIFTEIGDAIISSAQSPTHVEQGEDPHQSGYITFTDQLGDYMQVDDMNTLLYADQMLTSETKGYSRTETTAGNKTTVKYTFDYVISDTNHVYPEGNLKNIVITVEKAKGDDQLHVGDLVTVKIPASLIPLRYYEIDKDGNMTIDETYPMRLFYDVSLKADAEKKIENPDEAMQAYINANKNGEGQVQFYSNKYKAGVNDNPETIGAYSHFVPATTNDFYYFQEDAPLYTDEKCTVAAEDKIDTSGETTYYYQRDYYKLENGETKKEKNTVTIPGNSNLLLKGYAEKNTKTGQYYIRAGAPRTTNLSYFTENKGANETGTAPTFIKPTWNYKELEKGVTVYLGNNGRISKDVPGALQVSKTVTAAEGHTAPSGDQADTFDFTVKLTAPTEKTLQNTYKAQIFDANEEKVGEELTLTTSNQGILPFKLQGGQHIKIYGLDAGVMYQVTESEKAHYTKQKTGDSGTIEAGKTAEASFTNTYMAGNCEFDTAQVSLSKVFSGRAWKESDTFQFTIENKETPTGVEAPMPENATVTVNKPGSGNRKAFDFGTLTFTHPGEYKYTVKEVIPAENERIPGVDYDQHTATINITVTDDGNGKGQLVAQNSSSETEFNNTYRTEELNLADVCGIRVTKVLHGHDMAAEQFKFTIKADDKNSAEKLGIDKEKGKTFESTAAADGEVVTLLDSLNMTLTQSDIGNTYSYTFAETKGTAKGYTYDANQYKLEITTIDNGNGTLKANVVLTNTTTGEKIFNKTVSRKETATGQEGITIGFENRYDGSTDVDGGTTADVKADKTLTGRSLKADEFTFMLAPKLADGSEGKVLQTEKNKDDGTIPFEALSYRTSANAAGDGVILSEAVKAGYATKVTNDKGTVYTLYYRVYEDTTSLPKGVTLTPTNPFIDFTVTVTDNGDGTLTAVTNYPDDKSKFGFVNQYGTDNVDVNITGSKILKHVKGLTPNDITGKFTFTLEAVTKGAPMPKSTTATNDAAGNVDFGNITFDLDLLNGVTPAKDGSRSKTFEYKVTESGSAAGVTNDTKKTKTFKITLTDDGNGGLTAIKDSTQDPAFTFTNTYTVGELPSSITDQINIDKELTGRDLKKGEFSFELLENGKVVATGSNDASGNVTFDKITYTQPGDHTYTVREVNNGLGGVTYDDQAYTVRTTITDNRDGTMNAEHEAYALIDGKELAPVDEITFTNKYEAKGTTASIGAVKRLTGKDLKDGQFTFQLKDETGKVIDEAKNDKAGAISFKALEFDKAGTYKYTISEVNDKQKEIKYDTSEKAVTITVKDSGDGYLQAQVESEKQLIFTNTFEAAGGSGTKTGDNMNLVLPIMMMLTAAAIGSVLLIRRKYHR